MMDDVPSFPDDAQLFTELVYDPEARPWFAEHWPQAVFVDADDIASPGRFQVTIPGVTEDEVYPLIMSEGIALSCLTLGLMMRGMRPGDHDKVLDWLDKAGIGERDISDEDGPEDST